MKKEVQKVFKQSYDQHESEVDSAKIWAVVQPKKKKRRGIIWLFFGFAFVSIMLCIFLIGNGDESFVKQNAEVAIGEDVDNATKISESSTQTAKAIGLRNGLESTINNIEKGPLLKIISTNDSQFGVDHNSKLEKNDNVQKEHKSVVLIKDTTITQAQTNVAVKNDETFDEQHRKNEHNNFTNTALVPYKNEMSLLPISFSYLAKERTKFLFDSNTTSPIGQNKNSNFRFTFLGTTGLFTDRFESDLPAYQALRSNTEEPLESFGGLLAVSYQWKNWKIEVGVNYFRSNRKLEWQGKYFGDEDGKFIAVYDSTRVNSDLFFNTSEPSDIYLFNRNLKKYNETHSLSIPITIGYIFNIKSFDLEIFSGASFHLFEWHHVDILDIDYLITDYRLNASEIKLNPDYISGLSLEYKLTNQFSVVSKVEYRYRITKEIKLNKYSNFYSLGFGMRYNM